MFNYIKIKTSKTNIRWISSETAEGTSRASLKSHNLCYVFPYLHIRLNLPPQVDNKNKEVCFKTCLHPDHAFNF
jgi:hypothetical protein